MAEPGPIATRRIERCASCGETRFRPLAMRYEHLGAAFPLVECSRCGLRFLAVQPTTESLGRLYQAEYFESDYRCGREAGSSFDESALAAEDQALLDRFEALGPGRRLLDVGCAAGWLLRHAMERGWQARGVELSESAARFAKGRGLDVFQGEIAAAGLPDAAFDLVYMGDVLEHVPDCRATLAEAARVLAPGGHLYLRGPITTHSLARAFGLALYRALGSTIVLREIPPGRAHGSKSALQRAGMAAIDAVNLPLTALFGARGDRITAIARRPGQAAGSFRR